ncbi:hypothetical protein [Treponema sp.]|uniref:DUF7694 domain-containing protein n=1 Tax=Treponema sp. TaxID=166 RepID=UPI00388D5460
MKSLNEIASIPNLLVVKTGIDGGMGTIYLNGIKKEPANIVWSSGEGWEHVSVSYPRRTPTWEEMCKVKDFFWNDDETVVQYHPAKSEYVNIHPYCLHLWKPKDGEYMLPKKCLI